MNSPRTVLSLWKGRIPQSMAGIALHVAESHGLTVEDLKLRCSVHEIAHPRQEAMWRMRQTGRFSLPQIGRFFDRDHTTVLWAVRAYERRLLKDAA